MLESSAARCILCQTVYNLLQRQLNGSSETQRAGLNIAGARIDTALEIDWHQQHGRLDDNEMTHSARLRVNCFLMSRNTDDVNMSKHDSSITFFFQRNQSSLDPADDPPTNTRPYIARTRPSIIDYHLLRKWHSLCQNEHGDICAKPFSATPKILPRVIDVEHRCLRKATNTDSWVCLSYVWGAAKTLTLQKQNEQHLHEPNSLTSNVLPAITEDALIVAKGLNCSCLWVDSLCIIQDDEQDKARFISQMDAIYAWASIVLFATTGVDANSHLPGVSVPRDTIHEAFTINNISLIQTYDPIQGVSIDLRTQRAKPYIGTSVWDTRGWTLQERFLAARALVFTQNQVYWECDLAFWCEDSYRETPGVLADPRKTSLCGGELNLTWKPADFITFDHYYRVLVGEFSIRNLKYESDALNAFAGIINAFRRGMNIDFFWGLPACCMESSLSWGNRTSNLRRRRNTGTADGSSTEVYGPSWSWASWIGDGSVKLDTQNLVMQRLGIDFYYLSKDSSHVLHAQQKGSQVGKVDLLAEGSIISKKTCRQTIVVQADIPKNVPYEALHSLLFFWTAIATVELCWVGASDHSSERHLSLIHDQREIRVSWSHFPSADVGGPLHGPRKKVEIIAVSQNRGDFDGGHLMNGAIGIMLISRTSNVAHREGLAWMAIQDWISLKGRVWNLIVLG